MSAFFEFSITNPLANDFIRYWSNFYDYPDNWKYEQNIGRALTPQSVQLLYEWKNGGKMSEAKSRSVSENYPTCPPEFPEKRYLSADDSGGAIWNIFYLHLTDREKWPIFDQHAYRSMKFIQCGKIQQIPSNKRRIYEIYQREYIPFFNSLVEDDKRIVDKALFACGRFLKIARAYKES